MLAAAAVSCASAIFIDFLPLRAVLPSTAAAVADTLLGHGLLGAIVWGASSPSASPRELLCVAALGVSLDVDHFIAARSLRPSLALALTERPFGHALLFLVAATALAACCAATAPRVVPAMAPLAVAVAWGTHQLRDATKRGFFLWPLRAHTPAVPYAVYLLVVALEAAALSRFFRGTPTGGAPGHAASAPEHV
jgi:hypothetical protein